MFSLIIREIRENIRAEHIELKIIKYTVTYKSGEIRENGQTR